MYLERFIKYLSLNKNYSPNTILSYKSDIKQFLLFCILEGFIEKSDDIIFNSKHIRYWIVSLSEKNIGSKSIKRKISSLKSYNKYLVKQGVKEYDTLAKLVIPKTGKKLPEFISKDKMDNLSGFEFISDDDDRFYMEVLVVELFYCTGIRRAELIELKVTDFDKIKNNIKVLGKGNKERLIPIPGSLTKNIEKYLEIRKLESPYIITTIKGEKAYPKLIHRIVSKHLAVVTTQKKKSPHVIRHTYATNMLNNGADINSIKELLGHSNLSATQIYTHTSFEKINLIYKQAHPRAKK